MSLGDWFNRYGSTQQDAEIHIRGYIYLPKKLTAKNIEYYDKEAIRLIQKAQELINDMNEYRNALAARYAELQVMPRKPVLELRRLREWGGKVNYNLTIRNVYEDGTNTTELTETYEGTERYKAIKRFEALKKERPGIEAIKDIEKGRWEKK